MRDYVCCLTFNNLAKKKNTSPGVGSCLENREKKNTRRRKWGGGGALETGVCSLRTYFIVRSFSGTMDDLFLA